jgi:hypothetical protein
MKAPIVHLITFGGGSFAYRRGARRLGLQAEASGIFKTITKVTDKTFPEFSPVAWAKHEKFILEAKKGFGYWLWKPLIIEQKLREIPNGDLLIYLDAGCELNLLSEAPRRRMDEYFLLAKKHGSLAMQMQDIEERDFYPAEQRYSKASLISAINPSDSTLEERQLLAGVLFFVNNESSHEFIQKWLTFAVRDNYSLLVDSQDKNERVDFKGHRHDQSIFSLLYKEHGKYYILDETDWKPDWPTLGANYPIWAMRNRSGISRGVMSVPDSIDRLVYWIKGTKNTLLYKVTGLHDYLLKK